MWPNPQFPTELVTFAEEIFNWKRLFCSASFAEVYSETSQVRSECALWFGVTHQKKMNFCLNLKEINASRFREIVLKLTFKMLLRKFLLQICHFGNL